VRTETTGLRTDARQHVIHCAKEPGEWLHALLYDWEDGLGEGQQVLSVEAVDGGALWVVE